MVVAARWLRQWRQRDIVTSAAAWLQRGGGGSETAQRSLAAVAAARLRDVGVSLAAMMVMVTRLMGDEEAMATAARAMVTATMVAGERWRWQRATRMS
jgi:hypothetical protein